jgi:tRNA uridine 5-carboxymethylaminomethyl modification enzyme
MNNKYDIIVVGGGHAGCEAASAAATMGSNVLLISMDLFKIAQMSCNPAIGGIAKGQIVREIDALGGFTGIVADRTMIQFRMLNKSKGPAMWSPRAQCDRIEYSIQWRKILESNRNISLWQDTVNQLIIRDGKVLGVKTKIGADFYSDAVILTIGTFQNGLIHIGRNSFEGGRDSESSTKGISEQLREFGFEVGRMKTGTPARIDGRSINFSVLEEQKGDTYGQFSFFENVQLDKPKYSCYITYTNEEVHRILERGFKDSPLYNGTIKSIGPRYCPSIEDKIVTFSSKSSHQIFLEPEGKHVVEYYLNGFSSSLPLDTQYKAIRKIKGLENAKIFRPGYAIEYDFYQPTQLKGTLETKSIKCLFFAGQINGTTGYEEAAAQGLIAGINAYQMIKNRNEFTIKRDKGYIGVLIDDLITKGVDEPYRMFTSRAEYRISLRQDNADDRLTEDSFKIGLASEERYERLLSKNEKKKVLLNFIDKKKILPNEVNSFLIKSGTSQISEKTSLSILILRPQIELKQLLKLMQIEDENSKYEFNDEIIESIDIFIKYKGYVEREAQIANKINKLEEILIPSNFDYNKVKSISTEARAKLKKVKPLNIKLASAISGVSPSDISIILIYLGR